MLTTYHYPKSNLWKGLVACYAPFLCNTHKFIRDYSGYDNHGIEKGSTGINWNTHQYGPFINIPNSNGWIDLDQFPILDTLAVGNFNLSIVAWIKWNTFASNYGIISNSQGATAATHRLNLSTATPANLKLILGDGSAADDLRSSNVCLNYTTNKWICIGVTINSNNRVVFYRDGKQYGIKTKTKSVATSTESWKIGKHGNNASYCLNGGLLFLAIYNRTLSQSEIIQHSTNPHILFYPLQSFRSIDEPTLDRYNNSGIKYVRGRTTTDVGMALNDNFILIADHMVTTNNPHYRKTHVLANNTNLVSNQRQQIFSNRNATTSINLNLPTPVIGDEFIFLVEKNSQTLRATATNNSIIRSGTIVSNSNGYIESSNKGSVIRLVAIDTTTWIVRKSLGHWSIST